MAIVACSLIPAPVDDVMISGNPGISRVRHAHHRAWPGAQGAPYELAVGRACFL